MMVDQKSAGAAEQIAGRRGIESDPGPIARNRRHHVSLFRVSHAGDQDAVVLRAPGENLAVGGSNIQTVEHAGHDSARPVGPSASSIASYGDAAVIARDDDVILGPEQGVMVGVGVVLGAGLRAADSAPMASRIVSTV